MRREVGRDRGRVRAGGGGCPRAARRHQATYLRFFGKTTPSQTQKFGVGREIEIGRQLLVELGRNPSELLAQTWLPRVKEATDALEIAAAERSQTVNALAPQQVSVVLLRGDINRELDRLEGRTSERGMPLSGSAGAGQAVTIALAARGTPVLPVRLYCPWRSGTPSAIDVALWTADDVGLLALGALGERLGAAVERRTPTAVSRT